MEWFIAQKSTPCCGLFLADRNNLRSKASQRVDSLARTRRKLRFSEIVVRGVPLC